MKELSKKSPYWLPKDRFLELKHFVKQWDDLIAAKYEALFMPGYGSKDVSYASRYEIKRGLWRKDPTAVRAMKLMYYDRKIDILHGARAKLHAIMYESESAFSFVMRAIRSDLSYDATAVQWGDVAPISRRKFYEYVRYFYWVLDQIEKQEVLR